MAPSSTERRSTFALLRGALSGEEHDFTRGDLRTAIALLAIPMVLEMGMESLFGVVDVFFVSRLGADAVAAVGLTEALMILIYSLGFGLGVPAMSLVAQRTGEKRHDEAALTAVQVALVAALIGLVLSIPGGAFAPELLRMMGAAEPVIGIGARYTATLFVSAPAIILLFTLGSVLRGAGDAAGAMRALWVANGINIALDPCLIFGLGPFPELGLEGAAIATLIGRSTGVLYQLSRLRRAREMRVAVRHLQLRPPIIAQLLRMSVGSIGQNLVETASWILLIRIISPFGGVVLAGYTIAVRVLIFALLPGWGLANAAATLVGQNLGAGQPERAAQSVWLSGWYNTAFLALFAIVIVVFDTTIIGWFTRDADVLREGASCLRIIAYGYVFYGWGMVMVQAFNGSGHTGVPLAVNLFCFWLVKLPLAYLLARPFALGPAGVWIAVTFSYTLSASVGIVLFRRGRWRVAVG
ncbi:MAG: MATE family efflux transporter [Myxococcales bacterium]|nr:MATE family efflux transporter [Myxococcales bacterium]